MDHLVMIKYGVELLHHIESDSKNDFDNKLKKIIEEDSNKIAEKIPTLVVFVGDYKIVGEEFEE